MMLVLTLTPKRKRKLLTKLLTGRGGRGKDFAIKEVSRLLSEGLGRDSICKRLLFSKSRFYQIKKKLSLLGLLDSVKVDKNKLLTGVCTGGGEVCSPNKNEISGGEFWRLHRGQIKVRVEKWDDFGGLKGRWCCFGYKNSVKYCDVRVDGVVVRCFGKVVDVYAPAFFGLSVEECDRRFFSWLLRFMEGLGTRLGCVFTKSEGLLGLLVVRREYALVGALNSKAHIKRNELLRVFDEAGRLRYLIDRSLGVPEFEAVEPKLSQGDARLFESFYLDVAKGRWFLLQKGVGEVAETVKGVVLAQQGIIKVLRDKGLL